MQLLIKLSIVEGIDMKILITCPPMLGLGESMKVLFPVDKRVELTTPDIVQTLSVDELIEVVPEHDGWIIGDDPATAAVFEAGVAGKLRAAVKWGIGTDNVDFGACGRLGVRISNTPNMFGAEVADIALGYVIGLARHTFEIDREVRGHKWPKPPGMSLQGKTAAVIGFGDIGKNTVRRLHALDMNVIVYDPVADVMETETLHHCVWPQKLELADFVIINCALTKSSFHMINQRTLSQMKSGVRIVNVGRGPIIDEVALIDALASEHVFSVALDVFENEPLASNSKLREFPRCIFGSHNASNTREAVVKTSQIAVNKLIGYLQDG